ncbi:MAG: hypothetical protein ACE5PM_09820 [Candidatus Hydrothermarchaeales archaeon]
MVGKDEELDFKWIGIGIVYILTLQLLGGIFLGILGMISLGSILLISGFAYFIGGVIVGKQAPGKNILELAASALFATGFGVILGVTSEAISELMTDDVIVFIITLPFFLAIVGGLVGERWRESG